MALACEIAWCARDGESVVEVDCDVTENDPEEFVPVLLHVCTSHAELLDDEHIVNMRYELIERPHRKPRDWVAPS